MKHYVCGACGFELTDVVLEHQKELRTLIASEKSKAFRMSGRPGNPVVRVEVEVEKAHADITCPECTSRNRFPITS